MTNFFFPLTTVLTLLTLAQPFAAQTPPSPTFDVASVKPNKSGEMGVRIMLQPGGRFTANNITLGFLIGLAYDVKDFQITGGPPWLNSDHYDIEAKAAPGLDPPHRDDLRTMTEEQRNADMARRRQMVQALLADRFKLVLHKESKLSPVYALVVAKNGLKIKELPPAPADSPLVPIEKQDPDHPPRGSLRMGDGELMGVGLKLADLAGALSDRVGRKVIDKTGLTGDYTFTLKWTPDDMHAPATDDADTSSLFTAMQQQLGLKLESQKAPLDLLIIDHAEKASEN